MKAMRKTGIRRWLLGAACLGIVATAPAACKKAEARTPGPVAMLTTPAAPSPLIIPVSTEPPEPPAAPPEKPPAAPARPTGSTGTRPPPATPPPTNPPTDPPTTGPPPILTTGSLPDLEARARARLDLAQKDLARVSRARLGADAQDQYDSAARFIKMAQDAIAIKNFVFAVSCADKAAALAALLVK
jgi:hypothetical protein